MGRNKLPITNCPHVDRKHQAKGLCFMCYFRDWKKKNREKVKEYKRKSYKKHRIENLRKQTIRNRKKASEKLCQKNSERLN